MTGRLAGVGEDAGRGALVGMLVATIVACGCSDDVADRSRPRGLDPPAGLKTSLLDEIKPMPGDRIKWSTFWRLCWDAYPGSQAYELRPLTDEGDPGRPRRQTARCFRIQAAAGDNARSRGLALREEQLALQQGQLAYGVRAILRDGRVTPWSAAVAVGEHRIERDR